MNNIHISITIALSHGNPLFKKGLQSLFNTLFSFSCETTTVPTKVMKRTITGVVALSETETNP